MDRTAIDTGVNIGGALARDLREVGINTLEKLRASGAEKAWVRLRTAGLRDCVHSRLALEGAVRGVHWTDIDPGEQRALGRLERGGE